MISKKAKRYIAEIAKKYSPGIAKELRIAIEADLKQNPNAKEADLCLANLARILSDKTRSSNLANVPFGLCTAPVGTFRLVRKARRLS
ncbi:MAG: hypothetical protein WC250_01945 [Candidatus Paceibacterota bacterium]|jgi:hypothetical protein